MKKLCLTLIFMVMVFTVFAWGCSNPSVVTSDTESTETTTVYENAESTVVDSEKEDLQQTTAKIAEEDYVTEASAAVYSESSEGNVPVPTASEKDAEPTTAVSTEAGEVELDFSEFE